MGPIKSEISSDQRVWSEFTPEDRCVKLKIVGKRCLRVRRKMLGFAKAIWRCGSIISNLHQVVRGHRHRHRHRHQHQYRHQLQQGVAIISNLHQVVRGHMCLVIRLY